MDRKINGRGVYCDADAVNAIVNMADFQQCELHKEFEELAGCPVAKIKTIQSVLATKYDVRMEKLTKEYVTRYLKRDIPAGARRILELRQQLGRVSMKKYPKMLQCRSADGRIRETYKYYSAHTGRWGGRDVQTQNIPRGTFKDFQACIDLAVAGQYADAQFLFGDLVEAAVTCIRSMLCAEPGNTLVALDFSSIEGRVLAWLAGESSVLEAYRNGEDMYKVAAMDIYHVPYDEVDADKRMVGKVAELALGFGGANGAFQSMASNLQVHVGDDEAGRIVKGWRGGRAKTVALWRGLQKAAHKAVEKPGQPFSCRGVWYKVENDCLVCTLPSGRTLHYWYPELRLTEKPWGEVMGLFYWGVNSLNYQWSELETYGGKLCENAIQGLARDLQADAMLGVEGRHPIVMQTHDEIVCEVPEADAPDCDAHMIKSMTAVPAWADGLPVEVDGWIGKRYRK
jgi:DNA polymerase